MKYVISDLIQKFYMVPIKPPGDPTESSRWFKNIEFNLFGIPFDISIDSSAWVQYFIVLGLLIVIIISVFRVMIGGTGIITSEGDSDKMVEARNKIIAAITGPIIYFFVIGILFAMVINWQELLEGGGNWYIFGLMIIAIGALMAANKKG